MGNFSCPDLRALHPSFRPGDIYRGNLEKRAEYFSSFPGFVPVFSHDVGRGYPPGGPAHGWGGDPLLKKRRRGGRPPPLRSRWGEGTPTLPPPFGS